MKKKASEPKTKKAAVKKNSPEKHSKKDFIVVGIGASAGGVKALQEFFSTMPPNSGMAFVVILHLSPEHESSLGEILMTQTTMEVTVVNETHKVEPNRVYVIPPNRQLEMVDGVIRSTALKGERGERVAIDIFFRTLAETYERNAVCVVMSGTGTDGTLGLKAIKEANGFAVVQSPEDAEHDSMPRSAIQTQLVDWILPVREMPEKLIQFRDSSERLHLTDDDGDGKVAKKINADESLREILTVLRVRTGHDFSNYKTPTLVRRIARHLQIHDLPDIPAYLDFLREKPEEIQSLLKNLLINVTNFFRDKDAWLSLERSVVPSLFAGKKAGDTVRVWSCGCASGEEAYSLAMLLSEYAYTLPDPPKIQVFATDVDDDAISEAREHRYAQSIEADVSTERLKRFFVKEGKYYRVKKELREMVLFAPHNVLRDPPFSKLDLVSCRNLLIYLNRDTQQRVMEIFHFALSGHGYLFLGSSETAEAVPQLFSTVDKKLRIYSRRPVSVANQPAPQMPVVGRWEVKIPDIKTGKASRRLASLGEVHFKLLEQYAPPSILVNQDFDIQYLSESAGHYLRFKGGEPSSNLLKLVNQDLLPDLRAALFTAQREHKTAEFSNVSAVIEGEVASVNIIVRAVKIENETSDYLLILFDEERKFVLPPDAEKKAPIAAVREDAMESIVERLEEELMRTKEHLRTTIEQHEVSVEELKASNEELQAINEELRSTTEELETSKEELQSVNEELTTVNHELKEKMDETTRTNSDLQNLMASTDIATIFLDRNFSIKRFTTPVEHLFNITARDIGRPLEHFTHRLDYPHLQKDAAEALRRLTPLEREISDNENRFYLTRFVPYRTVDDRIEGIVLNFVDITERKRAEMVIADDLRDTQILHEVAIQSVPDGNIQKLYDEIVEAAIALTQADAGTIQLYEEKTQELILLSAKNFPGEIAEHFARIAANSKTSYGLTLETGERAYIEFDSKKIKDTDGSMQMLLDIGLLSAQSTPLISRTGKIIGMFTTHWRERHVLTEREMRFLDLLARQAADLIVQRQVEEVVRETQTQLQLMMESVADYAIIFTDVKGSVTSWNKGAERIFGWTDTEMLGKSADIVFLREDRQKGVPEQERQTALKNGRAEDERWHLRKDGSEFYASGVMTPLRDGPASGFVKICRDQTDKLKAETVLRDKDMLAQLVSTQEDERRRIARDLHDHLGQQLTTLRLRLESLRKMKDAAKVRKEIEEVQKTAEQIDRDVDFLAWELRPAALDDLGLRATLGNFVNEWARHTGIHADYHATGLTRSRLAFETETNLYRIAQEALNNILKHAKAKNVSVLLEKRGDTVMLIVEDDGTGFDVADKQNRTKGIGLVGITERAKLCGGTSEIESKKGKGTTVFVRVPVKK